MEKLKQLLISKNQSLNYYRKTQMKMSRQDYLQKGDAAQPAAWAGELRDALGIETADQTTTGPRGQVLTTIFHFWFSTKFDFSQI